MAGSAKKSTKKFEKRKLSGELERRKDFAKIKQRQQVKAKKKSKYREDFPDSLPGGSEGVNGSVNGGGPGVKKGDLASMSVDEFFQGGFELPEDSSKKKKKKDEKKGSLKGGDEVGEEKGVNGTGVKRKRGVQEDGDVGISDEDDEDQEGDEDDLEMHKGDLEALAAKDPEFYKYLKENDSELLDFNTDLSLGDIGDLSGDDEDAGSDTMDTKTTRTKNMAVEDDEASIVTTAVVAKWDKAMGEEHSLRAMRQAVLAFRAAAYVNSDDEKEFKYSIPNPEVYHAILVTTLEKVPVVLAHHLPIKEISATKVRVATESKKFRTLVPLLKSHTISILHLLSGLSDASTIKLTLNALNPLLPYLLSFKKLLKQVIVAAVGVWSTPSLTDEATLVTSYLLLRRLAVIADPSIRETVFKQTYQGLIKGARVTNMHTLPCINLMKNSCADLWGLDHNIGYTTGFTSIRQLAIHLRTSITQPTKESYKTIYNWQYVHSLDFWSRVLSLHCSPETNMTLKKPQDSPLHPLIYPVVQLTLGALRLIPTPTYFPLRFHLTRSLLRISRTTTTYIPLVPSLLEVLSSVEMSKPPRPSTLSPLDFTTSLRAPKAYSRSRTYQDGIGQQVQELLAEFFACWAKNIAFPELIIPPSTMLKRWLKSASSTPQKGNKKAGNQTDREGKGNKNAKVNGMISLLLQKMQANADFILSHRRNVTFAPSNHEEVDNFLYHIPLTDTPMGAFVEGIRRQVSEREKAMEAGRIAGEAKRKEDSKEKEESLRQGLRKIGMEDADGDDDDDDDDEDLIMQGAELEMEEYGTDDEDD